MDYMIGGIAGTCGGFVSNPFEVIKIRQQLQGELQSTTQLRHQPYSTLWSSIKTIVRSEGLLALQKGLISSSLGQFTLHGTRLGLYGLLEQMQKNRLSNSTAATMGTAACWGSITGFVGSIAASPFFLIKTQIQAQSHGSTAVGFQHNYTGTLNAFRTIYARFGLLGYWHGFEGFAIRITICTGLQMMTYDVFKHILQQQHILDDHPREMAFLASISSGLICSIGTTPIDVIATRLYNQEVDQNGRGKYYRNVFDCCGKIVRIEGIGGLFKGFVPICLKYAPHTIVTLTTWEWLKHRRNCPSE